MPDAGDADAAGEIAADQRSGVQAIGRGNAAPGNDREIQPLRVLDQQVAQCMQPVVVMGDELARSRFAAAAEVGFQVRNQRVGGAGQVDRGGVDHDLFAVLRVLDDTTFDAVAVAGGESGQRLADAGQPLAVIETQAAASPVVVVDGER